MSEGTRARVLVVDDSALVRRYYRGALEQRQFDVAEALNGLEALEKLLAEPADLLIVDINMPTMDGLTFVETLRRQALPIASIPVVMASTESGPQDFTAARSSGANYYLVKPIAREKLQQIAAMLCGSAA